MSSHKKPLNINNTPAGIHPTFDISPDVQHPIQDSILNPDNNDVLPVITSAGDTIGLYSSSEDETDDDDKEFDFPDKPIKICHPCSQKDFFNDSSSVIPSVISLLDYSIFDGLVTKQDVTQNEIEAFVPIGGMVASEKKRKEFIDYLKRSGFISAISKMLLTLWEEETWPDPAFAVEYFSNCLGYKLTIHDDIAENSTYSNFLRDRIQQLEIENDWMSRHLDNFEKTETPIETVDPTTFPPIIYQKIDSKKKKKNNKNPPVLFQPIPIEKIQIKIEKEEETSQLPSTKSKIITKKKSAKTS